MAEQDNRTPPGWYPDGAGGQRWWDGTQWTEHSAPAVGGFGQSAPAEISQEQTLAMAAHLLGAFVSFLGPVIIYLVAKDDQPFAKHHAAEALNFQISVFIAYFVSTLLILVLVGLILLPIVFIANIVLSILAAVAANRGEWYRYPLSIRILPGARG